MARFPIDDVSLSVTWNSQVPRSSGLSGSTALLAATLLAVLAARGESPNLHADDGRRSFAELVRDIERHEAKIMCGFQDAYMIAHGGLQLMNFAGKHPVKPGPQATLKTLDAPLPFLLVTTGVERLSGSVHGPMSERWLGGERLVVEAMCEIGELAKPGADALVKGDYDLLAQAMNENQRLIQAVGGSGEAVDLLVARALAGGARAAKLAGAGMGGTIIALTEDPARLESALRSEGYSRFIRPLIAPGVRLTASSSSAH